MDIFLKLYNRVYQKKVFYLKTFFLFFLFFQTTLLYSGRRVDFFDQKNVREQDVCSFSVEFGLVIKQIDDIEVRQRSLINFRVLPGFHVIKVTTEKQLEREEFLDIIIEAVPGCSYKIDTLFKGQTMVSNTKNPNPLNPLFTIVNSVKIVQYKHGKQVEYFKDGKIKRKYSMHLGKKHGKYKEYYTNGKVKESVKYKNNLKHGMQSYFDEQGKLIKKESYNKGRLKLKRHKGFVDYDSKPKYVCGYLKDILNHIYNEKLDALRDKINKAKKETTLDVEKIRKYSLKLKIELLKIAKKNVSKIANEKNLILYNDLISWNFDTGSLVERKVYTKEEEFIDITRDVIKSIKAKRGDYKKKSLRRMQKDGYYSKPKTSKTKIINYRKELLKSLKASPNNAGIIYKLGETYQGTGEYSKAIAYIGRALEIKENADWYIRRGYLNGLLGNFDLAKQNYESALVIDPVNKKAIYNLDLMNKKNL